MTEEELTEEFLKELDQEMEVLSMELYILRRAREKKIRDRENK